MIKKIYSLLIVLVLLGAATLKAQNEKGFSFAAEMGVGSQLELGGRAQYGINQWVALDLPVLKYDFDYGKHVNAHELKIMAGARGFSPSFGPGLKAFMAMDLGYGGIISEYTDWNSAFAFDLSFGLYVYKGVYLGYGFGLLANEWKHKDHTFRIGVNF